MNNDDTKVVLLEYGNVVVLYPGKGWGIGYNKSAIEERDAQFKSFDFRNLFRRWR